MKTLVRMAALLIIPAVAACGLSEVLGPEPEALDSFVQTLDVQSFQALVVQSKAQVDVKLLPGGLTASELSVSPSAASDEERIQSRVVSIEASAGVGTVRIMLGDLGISFDQNTRFWFGDDQVEFEAFLAEVNGAIGDGFEPAIVAERPVPSAAQAPDDGSFLASDIVLDGGGDGNARLRLEIDADNLQWVADPAEGEPDGWLNVLGISIQLRVSDGTTEIESNDHDFEDVEEFEGRVAAVQLDALSFTLINGTTVRLVDRTEVDDREDRFITSLVGVAVALENGLEVVAWGKGAVESEDPAVLIALKVGFLARESDEPELEDFEGLVASADAGSGSFSLGDGVVVRIVDRTEVLAYDDDSPATLAALEEAIANGREVVAWGVGEVESEDPLVLEGRRVVLKARERENLEREFEGLVIEVDLGAASFTLESGITVVTTDSTEVVGYNDFSPTDLEGAAAAISLGRTVFAWGSANVGSDDATALTARRVVFKSAIEDFEKDVVEIDVAAGTLSLEGGWTVAVTDETELLAADDQSPATLQGASDALAAGDRVRVWGLGFVTGSEPVVLEGIRVTIRRIPVD
jgi:Domain of unknown function (DUF5666)